VLDLRPSGTIIKTYLRTSSIQKSSRSLTNSASRVRSKTIGLPKAANNASRYPISRTLPSRNSPALLRESITRKDGFNSIYALLHHHPSIASAMLKTPSANCPASVRARCCSFVSAGRELPRPHVTTNRSIHRLSNTSSKMGFIFPSVTKMKLSKDRRSVQLNDSLTLPGVHRKLSSTASDEVSARVDHRSISGERRFRSEPRTRPSYIVWLIGPTYPGQR
jgi:hypothetical protein